MSYAHFARHVAERTPDTFSLEGARLFELILHPVMKFGWQRHVWTVVADTGVQQGGTHSSYLFSHVINDILEGFVGDVRDSSEFQHFGVFGWAYIDDLLLRFKNWEQAFHFFPRLLDRLKGAGLSINLDKTTVMSTASHLTTGRSFLMERCPQHPLLMCTFSEICKYLKKNLSIKADLSPALLQHARQAAHQQRVVMESACRKLHWTNAAGACRLYAKYVASTWLWFGPLVQPVEKYLDQVAIMQTSHLVSLLKLGIPEDVWPEDAHVLLSTRRRVVITFLHAHRHGCTVHNLLKRKWHYLGHVLRMQPHSLVSIALQTGLQEGVHSVPAVHQARPGPWITYIKWGLQVARLVYAAEGPSSFDELVACAMQQEVWKEHAASVSGLQERKWQPVHETLYAAWRRPMQLQVPWVVYVYAALHGHACCFV